MRKIVPVLLTLAMTGCLLSACGGSAGTATTKAAAATTKAASAAAATKAATTAAATTKAAASTAKASAGAGATTKAAASGQGTAGAVYIDPKASSMTGTVRFFTAFDGKSGTDALIKDFNSKYPNVKVEATTYKNSADGNIGLDTAMVAGNVDVIISYGVANTAARWSNNLLMDLTDKLKADKLDLKKEWGTDAYKAKDGKTYVFPSGGLSVYIAINTDKWKEAGLGSIPTEWTWDEYLDACKKMTKGDVCGGSDFNQTDYWTYSVRQSKGKNVFYKEDGTSDFDNPLWETVLQREVDAEKSGIWYSKAKYLSDSTKSRDLFLQGKNASTVESILTRYIVAGKPAFKIAYAPYPVNKKGEKNYMGGSIPNSFIAVAKNAKDPDAAYAFAKFAATYGNKYMYAAGHATMWTGVKADEIVDVVFGSKTDAAKYIDVDSFEKYVVALGQPAYSEDNITAFTEIQSLVDEYTKYVLNGEMTAKAALAEMKKNADAAIKEAKK
jgi:multiple sugar transport system substrate-binding protein